MSCGATRGGASDSESAGIFRGLLQDRNSGAVTVDPRAADSPDPYRAPMAAVGLRHAANLRCRLSADHDADANFVVSMSSRPIELGVVPVSDNPGRFTRHTRYEGASGSSPTSSSAGSAGRSQRWGRVRGYRAHATATMRVLVRTGYRRKEILTLRSGSAAGPERAQVARFQDRSEDSGGLPDGDMNHSKISGNPKESAGLPELHTGRAAIRHLPAGAPSAELGRVRGCADPPSPEPNLQQDFGARRRSSDDQPIIQARKRPHGAPGRGQLRRGFTG